MTASKEEIEELLRSRKFRYHSVPLPHGLATPGQDRSDTARLVLPDDLSGKTVLDVGCAIGYFSFEAERRGATRVVGTDINAARIDQANELKRVKGSGVEFRLSDVLEVSEAGDEHFDVVLALNLIHHLPDPVGALRRLAARARGQLVLEFPTLADPKFRELNPMRLWRIYNRLPVLGVSAPRKVDQTFVYAPRAVRRLLQAHVGGFSRIELRESPMDGRAIAIAHKK